MADRIDKRFQQLINSGFIKLPEYTPEQRAERKSRGAKCGHVTRKLMKHEPLEGKTLEFALSILNEDDEIAKKLKAGEQLSEYELYLMVDVYLTKTKFGI